MTSFLADADVEKHVDVRACETVEAAAVNMRGWRKTNEDAHVVELQLPHLPGCHYIAVFDGHSGDQSAKLAASLLLDATLAQLAPPSDVAGAAVSGAHAPEPAQAEDAFRAAFTSVDAAIFRQLATTGPGQQARPGYKSGTTALAALVTPSHYIVANAGDCRAVLIREGGEAVALSHDHRPDRPSERARIRAIAGATGGSNGGYVGGVGVSRALGDFKTKIDWASDGEECVPRLLPLDKQVVTSEPEVITLPRDHDKDAYLLLACDGVWDVMSSQEVADFVCSRARGEGGQGDGHGEGGGEGVASGAVQVSPALPSPLPGTQTAASSAGGSAESAPSSLGEPGSSSSSPTAGESGTGSAASASAAPSLTNIVCALLDTCLAKGSTDNMTVVLARLKGVGRKSKKEREAEGMTEAA